MPGRKPPDQNNERQNGMKNEKHYYTEWIEDIPVHPYAATYPMMSGEELQELADDIKAHGQREPIVITYLDEMLMDEPVVIDGRNRYAACKLAGVEPIFQEVRSLNDRELSPQVIADWIISHNLHRRHLTASQKAMVGQGYLAYLREEAKSRQGERNDLKGNFGTNWSQSSEDDYSTRSVAQAAKIAGVGIGSIKRADYVAKNDPELAQQVRDSKVTVSAAAKRIRESLKPKDEPTPEEIAEKLVRNIVKQDEEVIELAWKILGEVLGKN